MWKATRQAKGPNIYRSALSHLEPFQRRRWRWSTVGHYRLDIVFCRAAYSLPLMQTVSTSPWVLTPITERILDARRARCASVQVCMCCRQIHRTDLTHCLQEDCLQEHVLGLNLWGRLRVCGRPRKRLRYRMWPVHPHVVRDLPVQLV